MACLSDREQDERIFRKDKFINPIRGYVDGEYRACFKGIEVKLSIFKWKSRAPFRGFSSSEICLKCIKGCREMLYRLCLNGLKKMERTLHSTLRQK